MPNEWLDIGTARGRAVQYASNVSMLVAAAIFAVAVGKHWQWGRSSSGLHWL
jgi:hypothetical protein